MIKPQGFDYRNQVAQIKTKMALGLPYDEALKELEPMLAEMNKKGLEIAKKHKRRFTPLTARYVLR